MYSNGQTLRHRETNRLARLVPSGGTVWAWDIGNKTAFVDENGAEFLDDIGNYTHIEDEFGRPYSHQPESGQFVDESAKKYLVGEKELAKMRREGLKKLTEELLKKLATEMEISNPFADGQYNLTFEKHFLKKVGAKPLYKFYSDLNKKYINGPRIFLYKRKIWLHRRNILCVIKRVKNPVYISY